MFSSIQILDTIIDITKAIQNRDIATFNNQTKALAIIATLEPETYNRVIDRLVTLLKSENADHQEETTNG